MPSKKAVTDKDDYTPQERLTAAALEYKKLEGQNQSSIERMYGALSSPFKVSNKPCEVPRAAVLRCFEEILGKTGTNEDEGTAALAEVAVHGSSSRGGNGGDGGPYFPSNSRFPSVHRCYDAALQYESCVLEKTLAQHHSLLVDFEARQVRELESAKKAATAAPASLPGMAPKKKQAPKKELTADDMRRLGMSEEDIARILAERGKSAEERRQEQDAAEARRRETEQRHKRMKELEKLKEELVRLEGGPRVAIRDEEDAEWVQLEEALTGEKKRRLRECAEKMVQQRVAEARRKREAEAAAYQETLSHLTPEEREAFVAAQIAAEHARLEAELQAKEKQQQREERRLARERAARRAQRQRRRQDGEEDEEDEDMDDLVAAGGGAKATRERISAIDELSVNLHDKYD